MMTVPIPTSLVVIKMGMMMEDRSRKPVGDTKGGQTAQKLYLVPTMTHYRQNLALVPAQTRSAMKSKSKRALLRKRVEHISLLKH